MKWKRGRRQVNNSKKLGLGASSLALQHPAWEKPAEDAALQCHGAASREQGNRVFHKKFQPGPTPIHLYTLGGYKDKPKDLIKEARDGLGGKEEEKSLRAKTTTNWRKIQTAKQFFLFFSSPCSLF